MFYNVVYLKKNTQGDPCLAAFDQLILSCARCSVAAIMQDVLRQCRDGVICKSISICGTLIRLFQLAMSEQFPSAAEKSADKLISQYINKQDQREKDASDALDYTSDVAATRRITLKQTVSNEQNERSLSSFTDAIISAYSVLDVAHFPNDKSKEQTYTKARQILAKLDKQLKSEIAKS